MANCCKDCDRLRPKSQGSAPPRTELQPATMYDHFVSFQKFKQVKMDREKTRLQREEFLKGNANFTDWNPSELFQQMCSISGTMRRVHERSQNEYTSVQSESGATGDVGASDKPLKKKLSLLTISRTPVQCPIGACQRMIGSTSVLSHYLRDHNEEFGVQYQEIHGDKRSVLIFDPTILDFRDNVCLGLLAYGGIKEHSSTAPADRGICMHNAFLPKPQENLDAHLPILIMACKTSWSAALVDKELEAKVTDPLNEQQHLLVVWLVSVQTTKPIHCTVTVYDKSMTSSRSVITQVRHLYQSQNPSEFLHEETNCLRLGRGEVDILSNSGNEFIHMEVMINEFDQ